MTLKLALLRAFAKATRGRAGPRGIIKITPPHPPESFPIDGLIVETSRYAFRYAIGLSSLSIVSHNNFYATFYVGSKSRISTYSRSARSDSTFVVLLGNFRSHTHRRRLASPSFKASARVLLCEMSALILTRYRESREPLWRINDRVHLFEDDERNRDAEEKYDENCAPLSWTRCQRGQADAREGDRERGRGRKRRNAAIAYGGGENSDEDAGDSARVRFAGRSFVTRTRPAYLNGKPGKRNWSGTKQKGGQSEK